MVKIFVTVLVFMVLIFPASVQAGYEEGLRAYQSEDWFEAIKELRPLAERGNAEALVLLGNMYMDGNGVIQSYDEARRLYRRAAELDHAEAQVILAVIYEKGLGAEADSEEAFKWFKRAAERGHPLGQFFVGRAWLGGR